MIKSFHGEIIEIGRIAFEEIANPIDKTAKNAKIASAPCIDIDPYYYLYYFDESVQFFTISPCFNEFEVWSQHVVYCY